MIEDPITRFKKWICSKLGHKIDIKDAWYHSGIHCHCDRCGEIQSKLE